eukprot:g6587.t1
MSSPPIESKSGFDDDADSDDVFEREPSVQDSEWEKPILDGEQERQRAVHMCALLRDTENADEADAWEEMENFLKEPEAAEAFKTMKNSKDSLASLFDDFDDDELPELRQPPVWAHNTIGGDKKHRGKQQSSALQKYDLATRSQRTGIPIDELRAADKKKCDAMILRMSAEKKQQLREKALKHWNARKTKVMNVYGISMAEWRKKYNPSKWTDPVLECARKHQKYHQEGGKEKAHQSYHQGGGKETARHSYFQKGKKAAKHQKYHQEGGQEKAHQKYHQGGGKEDAHWKYHYGGGKEAAKLRHQKQKAQQARNKQEVTNAPKTARKTKKKIATKAKKKMTRKTKKKMVTKTMKIATKKETATSKIKAKK